MIIERTGMAHSLLLIKIVLLLVSSGRQPPGWLSNNTLQIVEFLTLTNHVMVTYEKFYSNTTPMDKVQCEHMQKNS